MALDTPMSDFEDALLAVCAKRNGAGYVVTRDEGFISADNPIPAKKSEYLLSLLEAEAH